MAVKNPESEIIEQLGCASTTYTTDFVEWVYCQATARALDGPSIRNRQAFGLPIPHVKMARRHQVKGTIMS